MKSWRTNWDAIVTIFKFSPTLLTILYTTNAIESLNATLRQLNRQLSVFPNDTALLKALFLATELAKKNWTMPLFGLNLRRVVCYFRGSFTLLTSRSVFFTDIFSHSQQDGVPCTALYQMEY